VTQLSRLPLLWRVFAINATLLVIAASLLAFTPVTISAPIAVVEALGLVVALAVMLSANFLLLRQALRPIATLARQLEAVDLLRPAPRLVEEGGIETAALVRAFNRMLARLERERRESGARALRAQEAERLRIARGLHDEVGQVLTGVLLQLDAVARADGDDRQRDVEETKDAVRQALDEVRRIARELRPEMLEQLGLASALTELARRFGEQTRIAVEHDFAATLPPLSDEAELTVYRVAQEGLTNVARHSGASRVAIALRPGADSVVLSLVDDGRGIDDDAQPDGSGGLRGMRERAVLVGGALAIKRADEGGVEIRLEVPAART
jgi:two-component system sensor histidine kinase UhpB